MWPNENTKNNVLFGHKICAVDLLVPTQILFPGKYKPDPAAVSVCCLSLIAGLLSENFSANRSHKAGNTLEVNTPCSSWRHPAASKWLMATEYRSLVSFSQNYTFGWWHFDTRAFPRSSLKLCIIPKLRVWLPPLPCPASLLLFLLKFSLDESFVTECKFQV